MGLLKIIKKVIHYLKENKWQYRLHGNHIRVLKNGFIKVGVGCKLSNSSIIIEKNSSLRIGRNVIIDNCIIYVNGSFSVEDYTFIKGGVYTIDNGALNVGHHSKLSAKRFWIRFGGVVNIGDYTNINEGSEVRCDEAITIGNYNQISFNVNIWDTNTHNIYPLDKRREITEKYWPYFGKEIERPKTKPVHIGDDCWIGENAAILKGTSLNNEVIVGYGTVLIGQSVNKGKKIVSSSDIRII